MAMKLVDEKVMKLVVKLVLKKGSRLVELMVYQMDN